MLVSASSGVFAALFHPPEGVDNTADNAKTAPRHANHLAPAEASRPFEQKISPASGAGKLGSENRTNRGETDRGAGKATAKPQPGTSLKGSSQEARREALKDPNSALFKELQQLKERDREVRRHEQAHVAAAGTHAIGGPHYELKRGPDGKQYAVGGHVNIDTSRVPGDPEATLRKAQTIRRAALAPAEPSSQDRRVASKASTMALEARQEIAQLRLEKLQQSHTSQPNQTASGRPDTGPDLPIREQQRIKLENKIATSGVDNGSTSTLKIAV